MSEIPAQVWLSLLFMFGVLIWFKLRTRQRLSNMDSDHSRFRASELARTLGLQVVEGDPDFNLFVPMADATHGAKLQRHDDVEITVRLAGEYQGVPLALDYHLERECETGTSGYWSSGLPRVVLLSERRDLVLRLAAQAGRVFHPFEVISREAPVGPIPQTLELPYAPTQDPAIDSIYAVYTRDTSSARRVAQLLPMFADFASCGVHLVGDGRTIAFQMHDRRSPLLSTALYDPARLAERVVQLARAI